MPGRPSRAVERRMGPGFRRGDRGEVPRDIGPIPTPNRLKSLPLTPPTRPRPDNRRLTGQTPRILCSSPPHGEGVGSSARRWREWCRAGSGRGGRKPPLRGRAEPSLPVSGLKPVVRRFYQAGDWRGERSNIRPARPGLEHNGIAERLLSSKRKIQTTPLCRDVSPGRSAHLPTVAVSTRDGANPRLESPLPPLHGEGRSRSDRGGGVSCNPPNVGVAAHSPTLSASPASRPRMGRG